MYKIFNLSKANFVASKKTTHQLTLLHFVNISNLIFRKEPHFIVAKIIDEKTRQDSCMNVAHPDERQL